MPFALVHFNAMLLLIFIFSSPIVVSCFTGGVTMCAPPRDRRET